MEFLGSFLASVLIRYIDKAPSNRDLALEIWTVCLVLCASGVLLSCTWFVVRALVINPLPNNPQVQIRGK